MQLNILLTGATGFIGSHLVKSLIEEGCKIIILKHPESDTWRINSVLKKTTLYNTNDDLSKIFAMHQIDVIIHLATFYRKTDKAQDVSKMDDTNVTFPSKLLEIGVLNGVKAFINTGTFFEYDYSTSPIDEKTPTNPFNYYSKTKLNFEKILKTYSNKIVINTFRLFTPYGEMDNEKLVTMVIKKGFMNEKLQLSDGFQKLDFIYVNDIVRAYLASLRRISFGLPPEYEVFNLGSGVALSIRDIVYIIEKYLGKTINKSWGSDSNTGSPIVQANIFKAQEILGWKPIFSIHQGIRNTVSYYKSKGR